MKKRKILIVLGIAIAVVLLGLMTGAIPRRLLVGCGVPDEALGNLDGPYLSQTNVFTGRIVENMGTSSEKYAGALYKVEVLSNAYGNLDGTVVYDHVRAMVDAPIAPFMQVGKVYKFESRFDPKKCVFRGTRPVEVKEQQ